MPALAVIRGTFSGREDGMSRRDRKRGIDAQVQAAKINAQATVASAEIQAKGSRSTTLISIVGAAVVALVTGLCGVTNTLVTALPNMFSRPGPVTATVGPVTATAESTRARVPGTSDIERAIWQEQRLVTIEAFAAQVLADDCLGYAESVQRLNCRNKRLHALQLVEAARDSVLNVRGPLEPGVARIS